MKNVTLVAFYGDKPFQLKKLIQQLQEYLSSNKTVGDKFVPYQIEQVHGTIIGCEGTTTNSGIINQWFNQLRRETKYIDCDGLVDYLQQQIDLPLTICFGGYDRTTEYNFLSRDQHLYYRSFQLQPAGDGAIPILIGWSWDNDQVSLTVDNLRRSFQQFNLLHKYYFTTESIDNDFHLRLGTINCQLSTEEAEAIATNLRNFLESQSALCIPITKKDLAFVQYQDLSLTPGKTKIIPISEITSENLKQIYPSSIND